MLSGCALILAGTRLTARDPRRRPVRLLDRRST